MKTWEMEPIKHKLRIKILVAVSCAGKGRKRRGGVALLWKDTMEVSISLNHIDSNILREGKDFWRFTGLYDLMIIQMMLRSTKPGSL